MKQKWKGDMVFKGKGDIRLWQTIWSGADKQQMYQQLLACCYEVNVYLRACVTMVHNNKEQYI